MKTLLLTCSVLLAASSVGGCATRDSRDAPWDPKPGHSLIDVLPNWDHPPCRTNLDPNCIRRPGLKHQ
jgi:hypothetical protein